jgi:rhodanese-related sulfurtransferase
MISRNTPIQMLLILGLACVLGVMFNNANPLGLREGQRAYALPKKRESATGMHSNAVPRVTKSPTPTNMPNASTTAVSAIAQPEAPKGGAPNPPPPQFVSVTWPQAKEQLADCRTVLVDARMPSFFEAGHIPNAISVPASSAPEELEKFKTQYPPPATPLIIYCNAEHCHLSHALATILTAQYGYTNIKVMSGGYTEYLRAETAPPPENK